MLKAIYISSGYKILPNEAGTFFEFSVILAWQTKKLSNH